MSKNEKNVSVRGLSHVFKNFCTWLNSQLSLVAKSGDYNDLINKPNIGVTDVGSLRVTRDTDGNFFLFTHTKWSTSPINAWGGMYFRTSDNRDVFGFAARQTTSYIEKFSLGNNGYLRGYDTEGNRTVTLVINGGTYNKPDTQNITVDGLFVNAGNQQPYSANMYTIGTPDMPYQAMYAETFNTNSRLNDTGLIASNPSTHYSLMFGIGGTGVNRGIYDRKNKRWSVLLDDTDYIMTECPTPPVGDSSNKLATTGWTQTELATLIPVGTVFHGMYASVPDGFLAMNGQSVSKNTYANLYAVLSRVAAQSGSTIDDPDNSSNFLLPTVTDGSAIQPDSLHLMTIIKY